MSPEEQVADGTPQELWRICTPKEGAPNKKTRFRGLERLRWTCDATAGKQIADSIQRLNPSQRAGAPIVYRDNQEITLAGGDEGLPATGREERDEEDGGGGDDHEELRRNARAELVQVRATIAAELERLKSIQANIDDKRRELAFEVERTVALVSKVQDSHLAGLDKLHTHVLARAETARDFETKAQEQIKNSMDSLGKWSEQLNTYRSNVFGSLTQAPAVAELVKGAKDIVESVLDSEIAQTLTQGVNSKIAADIGKKLGVEIEPNAMLEAHHLKGRHHLKRKAILKTFIAAHPGAPASAIVGVTMDFLDGNVTAEQLAILWEN